MADKHIKEYMSSLYSAYEHCRKATKEALDLLSAHSTACYAIVIVINAAAMLLKATLAIELCYHFRPYHWKIISLSAYITSLGVMFIGRGTLFIYSVISLALRVIWQFLLLACCGLVKFLVMFITHLTSAVVYMVSFVLKTALLAISGVARVSRFLITSLPLGVIIAIVVVSLSTLVWRRYKREKLNRNQFLFAPFNYFLQQYYSNSLGAGALNKPFWTYKLNYNVRGDSDVKADEELDESPTDRLRTDGGRKNSPVAYDMMSGTLK